MTITVPIDINAIIKQLPLREKLRLVHKLEQETWAAQLNEVVSRIRSRRAVQKLSLGEVNRLVDDVRKSRYARNSRRP